MKILFVCSGNKQGNPTNLVYNQGESLQGEGIQILYFTIVGKGTIGYLKNVFPLKRFIESNRFDIIHAHYSLSAFVVSLSLFFLSMRNKPKVVVSLLGSDAYVKGWTWRLTRFFYHTSWDKTIVKTQRMKKELKLSSSIVLPNGVDINRFKPEDRDAARKKIELKYEGRIIVFIADPSRSEKNYALAKKSVELIKQDNVRLLPVFNAPNSLIPYYLNSSDLLLLTSMWEGSVNVVKEAMACNVPIVSTDVGDVKDNLRDIDGCFITSTNPEDISQAIIKVLTNNKKTNGREKIIELGLDSKSIAKKITNIYKDLIDAK